MLEGIIVVGVVAVVAAMTGKSFYRTMTDKNDGCAGNCHNCACRDFAEMGQGGGIPRNDGLRIIE